MRRWLLIIPSAGVFVLLVLFAAARVPIRENVLEYSGSCGRFRWCSTRYGIWTSCRLSQSESDADPPLKAFAPEAACAADWHRLFVETYMTWGVLDGGRRDPQASAIHDLLWFRRVESGMRANQGEFDTDPDLTGLSEPDPEGYATVDCGGHRTFITTTTYEVTVGTQPAAGKVQDCWLLTSAGELRHLSGTMAQ